MPDSEITLVLEIMRPLMDFWVHRDERRAAKDANTFRFWRDGMLKQLEEIRDGRANDATFAALKKNLKETAKPSRSNSY